MTVGRCPCYALHKKAPGTATSPFQHPATASHGAGTVCFQGKHIPSHTREDSQARKQTTEKEKGLSRAQEEVIL